MHLWTTKKKKPPRGAKVAILASVEKMLTDDLCVFPTALLDALRDAGYALALTVRHDESDELIISIAEMFELHHAFKGVTAKEGVASAIRDEFRGLGYAMEDSVVIGDSASDAGMLMTARYGIAFNPDPGLLKVLATEHRGMSVMRVTEVNHAIQITQPVRAFVAQARIVYEYSLEEALPRELSTVIRAKLEARGYHLF